MYKCRLFILLENLKKILLLEKYTLMRCLHRLKLQYMSSALISNVVRFIIYMNQTCRDNACHAILESKYTKILLLRV